jgi:FSR family fosmidomycin resistance protein-like MFS transporter
MVSIVTYAWTHDAILARMSGMAPFNGGAVARLAFAHLVNDINQAAVLGTLPVLVAQRGLSYVTASGLAAGLIASSAVVQPVLGYLADRRPAPALVPALLVIGAAGVAAVGTLASPPAIALAVIAIGVATSAFHPEALRRVQAAGGPRRTTALAMFAVGGNLGTALGPVLAAALIGGLGLSGLAVIVAPSLLVAALVPGAAPPRQPRVIVAGPVRRGSFARLVGVLIVRAALSGYLTTFVPLYLVRAGTSTARAGAIVTLLLLGGVIATPIAGRLADRFGARAVLLGALVPLGPLLGVFAVTGGALRIAAVVLVGGGTMATYSVAVDAAQRCAPGRDGLAGGIAMGLGSLGAVMLVGFGALADRAGVAATLPVAAALPILAVLLIPASTRG